MSKALGRFQLPAGLMSACFASLVGLWLFTQGAAANPLESCKEHIKYGPPSTEPVIVCRYGFALSHDAKHKVADWVAYHLTKEKVQGTLARTDDFRSDGDLPPSKRSELEDYQGSGYDRGHMAPAAAMKWDWRAMTQSFLLSNMAPQVGIGFNRHIWADLEKLVRDWTKERGELYVVTGPIYDTDPPLKIGLNRVSVPTHFYKVVFDPVKVQAIAFILPNEPIQRDRLPEFVAAVDEVEDRTDLNFLSELADPVEELIENQEPPMW